MPKGPKFIIGIFGACLVILLLAAVWSVFGIGERYQRDARELTTEYRAQTPDATSDNPGVAPRTGYKNVTDAANLYTIRLPENWNIARNEALADGTSTLVARGPDWDGDESTPSTPPDAERVVRRGELRIVADASIATHAPGRTNDRVITVGGESGTMHFLDDDNSTGRVVDAHVTHNGKPYLFELTYDPVGFVPDVFMEELLSSLRWH